MLNLNEAQNRVNQLRRQLEQAESDLLYAQRRNRRANILDNVLQNIKEGRRINAIKDLRGLPEDGNISLIDAKDIIEFICENFKLK